MPKVTTPTMAEVLTWSTGTSRREGAANYTHRADGVAEMDGTVGTTRLLVTATVSAKDGLVQSVGITATGPSNAARVNVPTSLVLAAGRYLSTLGAPVTLQSDWHPETHDSAGNRTHGIKLNGGRVAWLVSGRTVSLYRSTDGWTIDSAPATARTAPATATLPALPKLPAAPVIPTRRAASGAPIVPAAPVAAPAEVAETVAEETPAAPVAAPAEVVAEETPDTQVPGAPIVPAAYRGKVSLPASAEEDWEYAVKAGQVIAMSGPSGAGKTHAVHYLAGRMGMPVVKFDASGVAEPSDWFGTVTLEDGRTVFRPSDLLRALTEPGRRVLLIDEANRAAVRAMNALIPVLDGSGTVTVPQTGAMVRLNPAVVIVFTANVGSAFIGVEPLDLAIRTRLGTTIEVPHLGESEECALLLDRVPGLHPDAAAGLARLGRLVRQSADQSGQHDTVSTRQLLAAAQKIALGQDPARAVETSILNSYSPEGGAQSERSRVRVHTAGITYGAPAVDPRQPVKFAAQYAGRCGSCSDWTHVQPDPRYTAGTRSVCATCWDAAETARIAAL